MHKIRSKFITSFSVTSLFLSVYAFGQGDDFSTNKPFSLTGDAVFFTRGSGSNRTFTTSSSGGEEVLSSDDLQQDFSYTPGYRVEAAYTASKVTSFEASFLQVIEWDVSEEVQGNGSLSFPFAIQNLISDFTNADAAKATYKSNFMTGELNYWAAITPRDVNYFAFSAIFGVRYARIGEDLNLGFTKGNNNSDYKVTTKNNLVGAQVGGDFQWNPTPKLSWDLFVKIGGYFNMAEQHTVLQDQNNTQVLENFKTNKTVGAFVAEGGFVASYKVLPWLNFHAGYEAYYLAGLALAPNQFSTAKHTATSGYISADDNLAIYGFWFGMTVGF